MGETRPPTFAELKTMTGQDLSVSDWVVIDQQRIEQFARATGDTQWVHLDAERARRESPFRKPIAHGHLTLALVAALGQEIGVIPEATQAALNYGIEHVRFLSPVIVGSRVRLHSKLLAVDDAGPGQYLIRVLNRIEIEGQETPALTCETLTMFYERRERRGA
ncbi:MAG: MaoC family dehydratase [Rhizobiaceae bacterium]|nr:MaoC family dehydratase [Rhizobiaceae bacterium]